MGRVQGVHLGVIDAAAAGEVGVAVNDEGGRLLGIVHAPSDHRNDGVAVRGAAARLRIGMGQLGHDEQTVASSLTLSVGAPWACGGGSAGALCGASAPKSPNDGLSNAWAGGAGTLRPRV